MGLRPLRLCSRSRGALAALSAALILILAVLLVTMDRAPNDAGPAPAAADDTHRRLLDAIWMVEASGRLNPPDGDGGKSIGPYQISYAYWQDAVAFDPTIGGHYQDCRDKDYAERVVLAYWLRYVPDGSDEQRARVHNGGPAGHRKPATERYWQKVQRELARRSRQAAR